MARDAKGHWLPGTSGNTGNRGIKRKKSLTNHLDKAMGVGGRQAVVVLIKQAVTTGEIEFPGGRILELTAKEYREFVVFLFDRLDGKPVAPVDLDIDASQTVIDTLTAAFTRIYGEDDDGLSDVSGEASTSGG